MAKEHVDDGLDVVEIDDRNWRAGQRLVGGNGDDRGIVGIKQRLADRGAVDFELGMAAALVAFHQHEIDRA